ncbi:MAG: hypothetical protein K2J39_07155 [Ruminococcus sp.]|nr:hypothetical protein [Ruminococcus sp.]
MKANIIEDLTDNYKVFLDDTALCEIYDNNQGVSLIDNMYSSGKHFIIPLRAVDSLQNGLLDMSSASYKIRKGIINLQMLQNRGVSEIRGEKGDINIITTLVSVFVKFKFVYRLALITQNRKLAKSILNLNNAEIGGFQILVFYLSTDGTLHKWDISDDNSLYYEVSGDYTDSDENEYDNNNEQAEENSRLSILQEWEII